MSDDIGPASTVSNILILVAALLSAGLLILAVFLPAVTVLSAHAGVQPRESLVAADGWVVLLPAALPLAACAVVAWLIRRRSVAALVVSLALLVTALVGFITIIVGVFVLPVGVLLVAASGTRLAGSRRLT